MEINNMKRQVLPINEVLGMENAIITEIDTSGLSSRNARNKYTKRKHWIEKHARKGEYRYAYATYDNNRGYWCTPKRGTYNQYISLIFKDESKGLMDDNINTIGFYSYWDKDKVKETLNKFDFSEFDKKHIESGAKLYEQIDNAYSNAIENAKKEHEENKRSIESYQDNIIYKTDEINKCTEDMKLYSIQIKGNAIKKRCRKSDFYFKELGYLTINKNDDALIVWSRHCDNIKKLAHKHIKDNLRDFSKLQIGIKDTTYKAPKGDSHFYGFSHMLMAPFKARFVAIKENDNIAWLDDSKHGLL